MEPGYQSLQGRRRAVLVVFTLVIISDLVGVGSSFLELDLLDRVESGAFVSDADIDANDARQAAIGGVQLVLFVLAAGTFMAWLLGAYRNTDVVAPGTRRHGHGWAVGGWFVPILNLWRPKQIVNDVWRAGADDPAGARPSALLLAWWLSWIATGFLGRVAAGGAQNRDTIAEIRDGDFLFIVSDGWDAIVAVMAIAVVNAVTRRLDHKAASALPAPRPQVEEPFAATSVAPPWSPAAPERPDLPA